MSGHLPSPAEPEREAARQREQAHERAAAPNLSEREKRKADEEESLDAKTTYEVIRRSGEQELERTASALAWSGFAAGLSMGFSFVAEGVLHAALPDAPWRPLVAKLGYSIGFLIVILGSQQLFTENTLTPMVPVLSRRSSKGAADVLRLWAIVFAANMVGAILFAWVVARTTLFDATLHAAFEEIGRGAMGAEFWTTFVRAVFAGWLIAILVWMLPAAQTAQVLVIIIITWLVGAAHLSHIIAGAIDTHYLVARGGLPLDEWLRAFVAPTLLGNTIGGVTLVAALNHAQVVGDER